jgi:hypothetical protein
VYQNDAVVLCTADDRAQRTIGRLAASRTYDIGLFYDRVHRFSQRDFGFQTLILSFENLFTAVD